MVESAIFKTQGGHVGRWLPVLASLLLWSSLNVGVARAQSSGAGSGRIVFYASRDGNLEIYSMNADGSDQTRLTTNAANDSSPALSADGSRIVFVSERDGNSEIYIMNADGSAQTRLTFNSQLDTYPLFRPDGLKIIFNSLRDAERPQQIYTMNLDGSEQTRIEIDGIGGGMNPSYSPDGGKIVFANYYIFAMNADGSGVKQLTTQNGYRPRWSPAGGKIAFSAQRNPASPFDSDVYIMNEDGSGQINLTHHAGTDEQSAFSPDGARIAFLSSRNGSQEIYAMNADGSEPLNLSRNSGLDGNPFWGAGGSAPSSALNEEALLSVLSTAVARSATRSVTFIFARALDTITATDPANYAVTVNGVAVELESVALKSGAIVLSLPEGTLPPGATVKVAWHNLLDVKGRALLDGRWQGRAR